MTARLPDQEPNWAEYERLKKQWAAAHPEATPREYEQAMARIADECGV